MPPAFIYKSPRHAAKKLAKLRGDHHSGGGWLENFKGGLICQGWTCYADIMLGSGYLKKTEDGRCIVTERGREAAREHVVRLEDYRVAQLKKRLSEAAQKAQVAIYELEKLGPCERSMDAVDAVGFKTKEIDVIADLIDWRC